MAKKQYRGNTSQVFPGIKSALVWLFLAVIIIILALSWYRRVEREIDSPSFEAKPNILVILVDDMGINDLSIVNGSVVKTPNLDQFARQGIYFSRHYTDAVCAPSRAALLTGRVPASIGFHPYRAGISPQLMTMPEQFQANGYRTHMVGKWHLGGQYASARPENQGFDTWLGMLEATRTVADQQGQKALKISYYDPWLENERGEYRQYSGHLTDLLAEHAGNIIRSSNTPWFLYLAFLAPHTPIMPSRAYARKYPRSDTGRYLALLEQLDQGVATVLKAVQDSGQWDNTIIVITSDNGGAERSFPNNKPYHGKKGEYLEGSVRTPLLVWWKGHWEGGKTRGHSVSIMDIAPTLLHSAGIAPGSELDGRDLFAGGVQRPLYWYQETPNLSRKGMLSADGNWRLLTATGYDPLLLDREGVRYGQPNQYFSRAARVAQMEKKYQDWLYQATAVTVQSKQKPNHWWEYTGDDYRRTPIISSYSIGFGLVRNADDSSKTSTTIATQPGYIDVRSDARGNLVLKFDNYITTLSHGLEQPGCHSLFITAFIQKKRGRLSFRRSPSKIQVYVDGKLLVEDEYVNQAYSPTDPGVALRVNSNPANRVFGIDGVPPVISTRQFSQNDVSDHHQQLMETCLAQAL